MTANKSCVSWMGREIWRREKEAVVEQETGRDKKKLKKKTGASSDKRKKSLNLISDRTTRLDQSSETPQENRVVRDFFLLSDEAPVFFVNFCLSRPSSAFKPGW